MPARRAGAGAAAAASDVFGDILQRRARSAENDRIAARNDVIARELKADEMIAKGDLEESERDDFVRGHVQAPSVQERLHGIIGGIDKAPTVSEVPTRAALGNALEAKRIRTIDYQRGDFSRDAEGADTTEPGALPSRQYGPGSTPAASQVFQARRQKLQGFAPTKLGSEMQGAGEDAQPVDIFAKWNPDTGVMDRTGTMPSGPTAGQKGRAEGTTAALSEDAQRPGKIQTAVDTENAMRGPKVATRRAEEQAGADVRLAELNKRYPNLRPEQQTAALQLGQEFAQQSKDFFTLQDQFRKMTGLAKQSEAQGSLGSGDLGLVFTYMKVLDPGSTVREGEQAQARNAGGVPEWVQNLYNRTLTGQSLSPAQRQDLLKTAAGLYSSATREHQQRVTDFSHKAAVMGVPADIVVREPAKDLKYQVGDTVTQGGVTGHVTAVHPDGSIEIAVN